MNRFYLILGVMLFLLVGYWFIAHSFVFVRLTAVFGLMFAIAAVLIVGGGVVAFFRRWFR